MVLSNITQSLIDTVIDEVKKEENTKRIRLHVVDPIASYIEHYLKPYFFTLLIVLLLMVSLLIWILVLLLRKHGPSYWISLMINWCHNIILISFGNEIWTLIHTFINVKKLRVIFLWQFLHSFSIPTCGTINVRSYLQGYLNLHCEQ